MNLFPFRVSGCRRQAVAASRRTLLSLAVLACLAFAASAAHAQAQYQINPARSKVAFDLGGFHEVNGIFEVTSGQITFDKKTGKMSGNIVVSADSGNSGDSARDKVMKKNELHVSKFPEITFAPSQFAGTLNASGESALQVHGTFTLIGKPHEIVVPMTVQISGNQCTAKGTFTLPYVSWGMKQPSMMFMKEAKDVKIDVTFEGTLSEGK
ncbi:MAG: YceI family protein [Acidobacteriaceae bacterium]